MTSPYEHFDLAAAGLGADRTDLRSGFEVLARKLELCLPGATRVHRRRRAAFSRRMSVNAIEVELGQTQLHLRWSDGSLLATRSSRVHDMRRTEETISVPEWLAALEEELRAAARTSADARLALERLLAS